MKILEYGQNWFIEDQLDDELLSDIKIFFDKHLDYFYKDKEGYSTTGDNTEQYWIKRKGKKPFYYRNKDYENIERRFREGIHGRLKAASLLQFDDIQLRQSTAWTVIGEEGSYHTIHNHTDGVMGGVSVVLYLNVPESEHDDIISNSIFLVLHTDPSSHFVKYGCPSYRHVKPEVGTLLIFPYHVPHGTYPQTKGIRQTFNVDYDFYAEEKSSINYS